MQNTPPVSPAVRKQMLEIVEQRGLSLSMISRTVGQPADWLRNFLVEGKPDKMPADAAVKLSDLLGVHIPREPAAATLPPPEHTIPNIKFAAQKKVTRSGAAVPARRGSRRFARMTAVAQGWAVVRLEAQWDDVVGAARFGDGAPIWVKRGVLFWEPGSYLPPVQTFAVDTGPLGVPGLTEKGDVLFVDPGRSRRVGDWVVVEKPNGTVLVRRVVGFDESRWLFETPSGDVESFGEADFRGYEVVVGHAPQCQVDAALVKVISGATRLDITPPKPSTDVNGMLAVVLLRHWQNWCDRRNAQIPLWAKLHPAWPKHHNGDDKHLSEAAGRFMQHLEELLPIE